MKLTLCRELHTYWRARFWLKMLIRKGYVMLFSLLLCGFSMRMKNAVNYIFLRKTQWRLKEKKSHYNTQSFVWTSKPITYVCKQPNTRKHTSVHHAGTNNGYAHDTQTYWYHITQLTQPGKIFQGLCAYWKSLGWPDPGNPEQLGPWSCSEIDYFGLIFSVKLF